MITSTVQKQDHRFTSIGSCKTIWAIPSIHAQLNDLQDIHDNLYNTIRPGDRVIYLGNYTGYGDQSRETLDEIITFRRMMLALPGMQTNDFIYLRGAQEEMWQKLLQIQFAPNPKEIMQWMFSNGLDKALISYGFCPQKALKTASEGVIQISKWTSTLRQAIQRHPGHDYFSTQLKRAAFKFCDNNETQVAPLEESSPEQVCSPLLFVSAGLNFNVPIDEQGDSFWWGHNSFENAASPYAPFSKVIRGYDPQHKGLHLNCVTATLDNKSGFGGRLLCSAIHPDSSIEPLH